MKNIVPIVTEQTTPSPLVSKNKELMKIKEMLILDRILLKSHFYSSFVLPEMTEPNDVIHIIEVKVIHETIITIKILIHKTDITLHPEIDLLMTKVLLLHNTLDHDMTTINEIHDPIALHTDLLTDPLTDMTLVIDIDHARIQETTTILQDKRLHIDHLFDQKILDFLDLVHIQIQETNLIQYNLNTKTIQSTLMYICNTQLKWQTLCHLQVGSILFIHIHDQTKFNETTHHD